MVFQKKSIVGSLWACEEIAGRVYSPPWQRRGARRAGWLVQDNQSLDQHHPGASRHPSSSEEGNSAVVPTLCAKPPPGEGGPKGRMRDRQGLRIPHPPLRGSLSRRARDYLATGITRVSTVSWAD